MTEPDHSNSSTSMRLVARGASWNLLGQLTPTLVTIFLTPYILHGLGITRYGLFVLTGSLVTFLNSFDGGITGTAQRYFGVYAGQDDVRRSTRLLVTLLLLVCVLGIVLSASAWFLAKPVVSILTMPAHLRPESVFLFRTLGVLITFSFIHGVFASVLQARHRFRYLTKAGVGVYAVWTIGLILTIHFGWGLRGIALVFVTQSAILAIVIVPASLAYLRRSDFGLLPWPEVRQIMGFAGRVQISGLSLLVTNEFDSLLIGTALTVRTVSFYNSGANFAQNVADITGNAIAPIQTALTNTFGRDGEAATFELFKRLNRIWVVAVTGWFAAAGGAAWFALTAWLGPQFGLGGEIAIIAILGMMFNVYTVVLRSYCTVIGRPGLESRFGVFGVIVNVGLTIPLVFVGAIGVVAATSASQFFASLYLLRSVRKRVAPELPNLFASVPIVPALLTSASVVGVELAVRPIVPQGGLGLIASGVPVFFGLAVFAVTTFGPRASAQIVRAGVARLRGRSFTMPQLPMFDSP